LTSTEIKVSDVDKNKSQTQYTAFHLKNTLRQDTTRN